jgi:hypothetical protein
MILAVTLGLTTGCSAEARAKRGLKRLVYENITQWNKYHQRDVKPNAYQSAGRFYRVFKERVDPTENLRKTNSKTTPFVATIGFTENTYLTARHASAADAKRDSHFSLSKTRKGEVVYALVSGTWKKKEIY